MQNPEAAPSESLGNLLGIKVVFCKGDEVKEQWVNLSVVHAISWTAGRVGSKYEGGWQPGRPKLPTGSPPGGCEGGASSSRAMRRLSSMGGPAGAHMCWWDGVKWECGETE